MLPKSSKRGPLDHGGLAVFSVLWRIEGGAWWRRLQIWQEEWIHQDLHGARKGHDALTVVWQAQAQLEEAAIDKTPIWGALLDYEKFFDLFEPHFTCNMMRAIGPPPHLAN